MPTKHPKVGDPIELGICLGNAMEPGHRTGRLVGIVHNPEREIERYVLRCYASGDGEYPTGDYRTTSGVFLVPHRLTSDGVCKSGDH